MTNKISISIIFILIWALGNAQQKNTSSTNIAPIKTSEIGLPYIQNYSPTDYGAFDQNWNIVQDSMGILYFANGYGILTYNGATWNLLKLPNHGTVFALTITEKGQIFVGGSNELGYLEPNSRGQLMYISLLSKLSKKFHDFNAIRTLQNTKDGLFFGSDKYIFKWDGKQFKTWKNSGDSRLYASNNRLFKKSKNKGLMELKNNQFKLVEKGQFFADKIIRAVLPYREEDLLIATEEQLYIYDGSTFKEFVTDVPEFFEEKSIYTGVILNDSTYAFGSRKKGLLIINNEGHKEALLSKDENLRSNFILSLYQDKSGLLWVAQQSGISKIEYPSPFTFFNNQNNTPGMVYDFQRFQEKIYAGTSDGLYVLKNDNKSGNSFFEPVAGDFSIVFEITTFQEKMVIATNGVYEIDEEEKINKLSDLKAMSLYSSKIDSNRLFIGNYPGLTSMYFKNNRWVIDKKFEDIDVPVYKIFEKSNGNLWLELSKNQVIRVSFDNLNDAKTLKNPKIKTYFKTDGFPENHQELFIIDDELYSLADNKVYFFDTLTERFSEDKKLFKRLGVANKRVNINSVDNQGNVWLIEYERGKGDTRLNQLVAFHQKDGTYDLENLDEKRVIDIRKLGTFAEFKDSIVWYKGRPGIVRHDLKHKLDKSTLNSKAIISAMVWQNDSLLFGGYTSTITTQLPFKNNQIRFEFTNTSFYDESKNRFQYILDGFDQGWSSWTSETQKDYTNLPAGDYTFKVRSKNIFKNISSEDSYSFSILSPWYGTWWAYLIYGFGAIAILSLILQWRSKELRRKNENLENIVAERTTEIRHKNELLNHQTAQLEELNDSKTRLYSNITHEFRTPLTVILGMADNLKSNLKKTDFKDTEKSLNMIRRNGKKLLHLVNELLDLAKVESGSMELNLVQTDVIPFVKYLSESFHSLAEIKQINLTVYSEIESLEMDIDVNKVASIISNLLSNAIKFTSNKGKIIVHLNKIIENEKLLFAIKVKDNGQGLAKEDITHLFDRFYQVNNTTTKQEGTGIGLSLTKEFVELMNGTVAVDSTIEKGSTFTVLIPITNYAVKTKEAKTTITAPIKPLQTATNQNLTINKSSSNLPLVLIIEDNVDVAHYLETSLKANYQTIHALDGDIGLKMAFEQIPDIIISDVMMPGKDGFEVCATLKTDERTDHIPIILLTAKVTTEDRLIGLSSGADAYLAKPFNKDELFTRLNQLILIRKKLINKLEKNGLSSLLKEKVENPQTKFLQQIIKSIHKNLDNTKFGPTQLAKEIHLSESQIYRKLKSITDKSTAIFIRSVRLHKAKELIENTDKTFSEIAYETGFNNPSWFSRAYKEEFGYSPKNTNK